MQSRTHCTVFEHGTDRKLCWLLCTTLLLPGAVCARDSATQSRDADQPPTSVSPQRQSELRYFLQHDCGSCHGLRLKGGLGPALLPENLSAKPDDYLVHTILEGRDNTAMPPWKPMLSRTEARWLVRQMKNGTALSPALAIATDHATPRQEAPK